MILNTDSFFTIGSTHKTCDDYSLSNIIDYGMLDSSAFSAICDGCSGSNFTDTGARIIAKCAENATKYYLPDEKVFRTRVLSRIAFIRDELLLNKDALDATLLFAQADRSGYEIRAYGDGSIIKIRNDGNIEFTLIEYPSGAPLYMNYYIDDERLGRYKKTFGLQRKIFRYLITPIDFSVKLEIDETGGPFVEYGNNDYKVIAVTSDGIASFMKFSNGSEYPADIVEIVRNLADFKSVKGEFIQRRMNGFKNYCQKNSLKHTDDFSIAGISFE